MTGTQLAATLVMLRALFNLVYVLTFITSAVVTYRWLDARNHAVPESRESAMIIDARSR